MRKKVMGRKFARNTNSRKALFRGLVRALFQNGSIETTLARAKAIQPEVDKLITLAKKDTLASKRSVMSKLGNDGQTYTKIFVNYLPAFESRKSGFTKLVHLPVRPGDGAQMVKLELSDKAVEAKKAETKTGDKPQVKSKKVKKDK